MTMKKVGFIGWRGMVGSVLMERMRAERDFDLIEPLFFSASQAGGDGPASDVRPCGRAPPPVKNARDVKSLAAMDILVSCQGSDYTAEIYPALRGAGWNGYWIRGARPLRME